MQIRFFTTPPTGYSCILRCPINLSFALIRALSFIVLLLRLLPDVAAHENDFPRVVETISRSVVGVGAAYPSRAPTGSNPTRRLLGSGFAVEHGGVSFVVTNAHVIDQALDEARLEHLVVFSDSGARAVQRRAEIQKVDAIHDLALLRYEGAEIPPMQLHKGNSLPPGPDIAFTGYPIGAVLGLFPATHVGIIAGIAPIAQPVRSGRELSGEKVHRMRHSFEIYQLDAIAYPGNSGSAVYLRSTGEVIGVMNSVFVKESRESLLERPSGIAYAIPVRHLRTLLLNVDS